MQYNYEKIIMKVLLHQCVCGMHNNLKDTIDYAHK